ncbi:FKBP-type peptidyl-prolyl cis-trans isomerase [Flavobacteriaceae bacterium M23B6Z8]
MMKFERSILWILCATICLWSCNNDDDNNNREEVRDVAEVTLENDAEIVAYLETHFYNYEEFQNPDENFDFIIRFDTIAGENAGKTPLIDQVKDTTIILQDRNDNDINFKFYYFSARDGAEGQGLTISDSAYARINGLLLDGTEFEEFTSVPNWFDFLGNRTVSNPGLIRGFAEGLSKFKGGDVIIENEDGTFEVENFGVGAFIIPSGLAYFNNPPATIIPQYAPLIYTAQLYTVNEADHDRDTIPSRLEDVDGDGNPANDDSDDDRVPDYLDADDDNDGVLTRDEYDRDGDGIPDDSNGDGIPDYLDRETRQ